MLLALPIQGFEGVAVAGQRQGSVGFDWCSAGYGGCDWPIWPPVPFPAPFRTSAVASTAKRREPEEVASSGRCEGEAGKQHGSGVNAPGLRQLAAQAKDSLCGLHRNGKQSLSSRAMASKTSVGFIGLGNMGNPMAKNLVKHGYPVIAYDVFPEACKEFQELGAQVTDSPADVAERADRIITMLPSNPNAIEVYTGTNGILKKVKKGSLLIDSSTIDPVVSKELAKEAEKMGAVFMDAPVSGGKSPPPTPYVHVFPDSYAEPS
ncbi:3-hydroxyisobutyrate dehydrogenase, mitochondrial [Varanus komodoensis]|nr:3-hydroxyisobutyrate dehydrogenase, mitochondrial [Varanus komodoensis]